MRAYTVADVFTVAGIFAAATENGGKLGGLLTASGGGGADGDRENPAAMSESERGFALASYLLGECLAKCEEKLVGWLASLNEMTVDQFNAQPPELIIDTIDAIITRPESKGFFLRVSQLFKKISGSGTATENG
jgi:hypothetical protein